MTSTWIVQTNIKGSETKFLLKKACSRLDYRFLGVDIQARQCSLPEPIPESGPLVVHGTTTLVCLASNDPRFKEGVFYDESTFQHQAYCQGFGAAYINAEATLMSWEEAENEITKCGQKFIKPPDDLKAFTGFVASASSLVGLRSKLDTSPTFPEKILVSRPLEVDAEWRLFVVDGQIISGSMYRPWGDAALPDELLVFAKDLISHWTPAPVFVLDIGRVEDQWKVIECNCFNWARFYLSRVEMIVDAVSQRQLQCLL